MNLIPLILLFLFGCAHTRVGGIIPLKFSEQASTAIIRAECNGIKSEYRGVFVCEEKVPNITKVEIKIMPVPGRVIYSNGLEKKVEDFNWGKEGFLFWKKNRIKDTWVSLDFGELHTVFGDTPIAFDVAGSTKKGVIVNRGIFYHRRCNDRDIPCSHLVVQYDCLGVVKSTSDNKIGFCNRMSGSSHSFEVPLKTIGDNFKSGSRLIITSGRSDFSQVVEIKEEDVKAGSVKFLYPNVYSGPDLLGFRVNYLVQGVQKFKQTYVLLVGYDPEWTGIDGPHYILGRTGVEFNMPVLADIMEVIGGSDRKVIYSGQVEWGRPLENVCAFAWNRLSGDVQKLCLDRNFKEVN